MFRIGPIRLVFDTPTYVAGSFIRCYSASVASVSSQPRGEASIEPPPNLRPKFSFEEREQLHQLKDLMREELRQECFNVCRADASREEIDAALEKIEKWSLALVQKFDQQHPFADIVDICVQHNLSIKGKVYERFRRSEEFKRLVSDPDNPRPNLYSPGALNLVEKLEVWDPKTKDSVERVKLVAGFFNDYFKNYVYLGPLTRLVDYLTYKDDPAFLIRLVSRVKKRNSLFGTFVEGLLSNDKMDRLKELMECKFKTDADIRIFSNRVASSLVRKLKTIKLESPASIQELHTIGQVLALGLKTGEGDTTGGHAMSIIFGSTAVNDEVLKRLVDILMEDSNVLFSRTEINRIETQLRSANQNSRAKLILKLKEKNPTYARWMNTKDLSDLVKEAKNLEQKDVKPRVLGSLYSVLLRKSSIPRDIDTLTWLLPKFHDLIERNSSDEWQTFNRTNVNLALRNLVSHALSNRLHDVFDKLWELRVATAYPADKILFMLNFLERGLTDKAKKLISNLPQSAGLFDEKALNQVVSSDFMRTLTSEQAIEDFLQLMSEHFTVPAGWNRRLLTAVQMNGLRTAISQENLDRVIEKLDQMGDAIFRDASTSFILIDLLKAAISANNSRVFSQTKEIIENRRDRHTAILYIGLSFLELNDQRWSRLLKKINHIPTETMTQLVLRETTAKRSDVLYTLFITMNKSGMSNIELEFLFRETVQLYCTNQDLEGLRKLYDEIKMSGYYMRAELKNSIELAIKKLEKSRAVGGNSTAASTTTTFQPKSSSPSENQHRHSSTS